MTITAAMVKELREATGAGMMDCKAALGETGGDMQAAMDWLRKKGIAKADKKSARTAADGLIGLGEAERKAALVEINAETDFVARNESFQELVRAIAGVAAQTDATVESLGQADLDGKTVNEAITETIATIGENIELRRVRNLAVGKGIVASYIHSAIAPGLGKIGVIVSLESEGDENRLKELGRQFAMHIAATNPLAVTPDDMDPELVEREKKIFAESARESGKPENIIEKMVEGRIRKFFEENALISQTFVIDGENTIEQVLKDAEKELGTSVRIADFVRMQLGEGIEKKEDNFAQEVAAMQKG